MRHASRIDVETVRRIAASIPRAVKKPSPEQYKLGAWILIIMAWIALAITVYMTFEKTRIR